MSFVRPEARAGIWRWRESLTGAGLFCLGLYWSVWAGGLLGWLGWALGLAGIALAVAGIQRARFRSPGNGPGIVRSDEGQISYFGPLTGGIVPVSAINKIVLDPTGKPAHWILERAAETPLYIPVTAEGSDDLFDAFASLPGMRIDDAVRALGADERTVVWQRSDSRSLVGTTPAAH